MINQWITRYIFFVYAYDSQNTRKFHFQGRTSEKLIFKKFFHFILISVDLREKCSHVKFHLLWFIQFLSKTIIFREKLDNASIRGRTLFTWGSRGQEGHGKSFGLKFVSKQSDLFRNLYRANPNSSESIRKKSFQSPLMQIGRKSIRLNLSSSETLNPNESGPIFQS